MGRSAALGVADRRKIATDVEPAMATAGMLGSRRGVVISVTDIKASMWVCLFPGDSPKAVVLLFDSKFKPRKRGPASLHVLSLVK